MKGPTDDELREIVVSYAQARAAVNAIPWRRGPKLANALPLFDALDVAEHQLLLAARRLVQQGGAPAPAVHVRMQ